MSCTITEPPSDHSLGENEQVVCKLQAFAFQNCETKTLPLTIKIEKFKN